jgi:hypothetical protein
MSAKITRQDLVGLAIHTPLALLASVVVSFLLSWLVVYPLMWVGLGHTLNRAGMLGPLSWWGGIALGFLINRRTLSRSACWVWIVGLTLLAAFMFWDVTTFGRSWRYESSQLFSSDCHEGSCLLQQFVTAPVLNSIGYSLGAWLALRFTKANKTNAGQRQRQDLDAPAHA